MAAYFISDLHLQADRPAMTKGLIHWLAQLNDANQLYILGDFFEVWVGDDYSDPMVKQIETALHGLSERGCDIFIMHGNRDFLIGEALCKRCGASLLEEYSSLTLGDTTALLLHGDSLCTDDQAYMNMRQLFRNPQWQASILAKSLEERITFSRSIRSESQQSMGEKSMEIMDVTPAEVDKALDQAGVSLMIHGHTHRPAKHEWQNEQGEQRQRIVLGDWSDDHGWYIRWQADSSPELVQFELEK